MNARANRIVTILVIITVILSCMVTVNASTATTEKEIEQKWAINVVIDVPWEFSAKQYASLDDMLESLPKGLLGKLNRHYGKHLTIRIAQNQDARSSLAGTYNYDTHTIVLYYIWADTFSHEIGHAVHRMLNVTYGQERLTKEWTAYNQGKGYLGPGLDEDYANQMFLGRYAQSSLSEDFAETFAWFNSAAASVRDSRVNQERPGVIQKGEFLRRIFSSHLGITDVWSDTLAQQPDAWAVDEINTAIQHGYLEEPYQTLYHGNITREDFCEILITALHEKGAVQTYEPEGFSNGYQVIPDDDPVMDNSAEYLDWGPFIAIKNGILVGDGNNAYNLNDRITRQEAAVLLARGMKLGDIYTDSSRMQEYQDANAIAAWAQDAVTAVSSAGIMQGTSEQTFSPTAGYTYQQAYISIDRLYQQIIPKAQVRFPE